MSKNPESIAVPDGLFDQKLFESAIQTPFFEADWPAPAHIHTLISTRLGGVSQAPYQSLNLGMHVGDNPEAVLENRRRLNEFLPAEPAWLNQTHSTKVISLPTQAEQPPEADASYTRKAGQVCVVMTADCLPILITNKAGTVVAAVHAGWRGLCNGIVENTLAALALPPEEILVWLGPAIGPDAFEVGQDVVDAFTAQVMHTAKPFEQIDDQKYLANIYALARERLAFMGIQQVYGGDFCTVLDREHFFSYRRDHQTGRMASCIWLDHA